MSPRPRDLEDRNILEAVEDPTNRLDVLLYGIAERFVEKSTDPMVRSFWSRYRNPVAELLHQHLGPVERTKRLKPPPRKRAPRKRVRRVRA